MTALLLFSMAGPASARQITIEFEGTLDTVAPELSPPFQPGDLLKGEFVYESTDSNTDPFTVNAFTIPASGQATLGSYSFSFGPGVTLRVIDSGTSDFGHLVAPAVGNAVNGYSDPFFNLLLFNDANVVSDISNPPLDPLPLIPGYFFSLRFNNLRLVTSGTITALNIKTASVPDAGGTLGFVALSCVGLGWVRRRVASPLRQK